MAEKTIIKDDPTQDVLDFMFDSDAHSLLVKVGIRYFSLMKLPVGKAVFIYGAWNCDPAFEDEINRYKFAAVVRDGQVYLDDEFSQMGLMGRETPDCVHSFVKYISEESGRMDKLFRAWYEALPTKELPEDDAQAMVHPHLSELRQLRVLNGPNADAFVERLYEGAFLRPNDVTKILSGSIDLEDFLLEQVEGSKDRYILAKTVLHLFYHDGAGLAPETLAIADAIRDTDSHILTVEFEHNGIIRTSDVLKPGFQQTLGRDKVTGYYNVFCSKEPRNEIFLALTGKTTGGIPTSYISRVTAGEETLYVRKDN